LLFSVIDLTSVLPSCYHKIDCREMRNNEQPEFKTTITVMEIQRPLDVEGEMAFAEQFLVL